MAALSPPSPACLTHRALAAEHVDVHANAFNPVNYGTTSSPIGGLDLQVTMSSHGYFKKTTVGCHIVYACAASRARVLVAAASRRCRAVAHTPPAALLRSARGDGSSKVVTCDQN